MRKQSRWLLPCNESTRTPQNLLFVDSETVPSPIPGYPTQRIHKLRLWAATSLRYERGIVSRRRNHQGSDALQFWELVRSLADPNRPLWIFTHNAGFDITALRFWRELEENRLTLSAPPGWRGRKKDRGCDIEHTGCIVLEDPPTIIECWTTCTRNRIVIVDTLNWYRCSLAELGDEFGHPKAKMPEFDAPDSVWHNYCANDVRIAEKAILSWLDTVRQNDLGVFKYTVSGQALAAFQHRFMSHEIEIHRNEKIVKMEFEAYFGGEVRIAYKGRVGADPASILAGKDRDKVPYRAGPVFVLDVNSFYPSTMAMYHYPTKCLGHRVGISVCELEDLCFKHCVIARVKIESSDGDFPVRRNGVPLYATGSFVTTLTTEDLIEAINAEAIKAVGEVAIYSRAPIFNEFVDFFWEKRREAKENGWTQRAFQYKILMNSLYGKFGQKNPRWVNADEVEPDRPFGMFMSCDLDSGEVEWYRSILWHAQKMVPELDRELADHAFPAIAAHVTANGRKTMRNYRSLIKEWDFYYQDTDSLHVSEHGYRTMQQMNCVKEGELGMLSLKGEYQTAEYRGPKNYTIDGTHVIAGLKSNAIPRTDGTFEQEEFAGLRSVIATSPPDGVVVRNTILDFNKSKITGRILADGSVICPVIEE